MSIPPEVSDALWRHLSDIERYFVNPRITLIVRAPDLEGADVLLTNDDTEKAISAIRNLSPTTGGEQ